MEIRTGQLRTASGALAAGTVNSALAALLFLTLVPASRRVLACTDAALAQHLQELVGDAVDATIMHVQLSEQLTMLVEASYRASSAEQLHMDAA